MKDDSNHSVGPKWMASTAEVSSKTLHSGGDSFDCPMSAQTLAVHTFAHI